MLVLVLALLDPDTQDGDSQPSLVLVLVMLPSPSRPFGGGFNLPRSEWAEFRRRYPLIIARETEVALVKYRAKYQVSEGKALNQLIRRGLEVEGLLQPTPSKEDMEKRKRDEDLDFARKHWYEIPEEKRDWWFQKFPELRLKMAEKKPGVVEKERNEEEEDGAQKKPGQSGET